MYTVMADKSVVVSEWVAEVALRIQNKLIKLSALVLEEACSDIIIGDPWLKRHKAVMDYDTGVLRYHDKGTFTLKGESRPPKQPLPSQLPLDAASSASTQAGIPGLEPPLARPPPMAGPRPRQPKDPPTMPSKPAPACVMQSAKQFARTLRSKTTVFAFYGLSTLVGQATPTQVAQLAANPDILISELLGTQASSAAAASSGVQPPSEETPMPPAPETLEETEARIRMSQFIK